MRVKLQLVMCHDDGHEETLTDVITLTKNNKRLEHRGLTLSEATPLLSTTQPHLLRQPVAACLAPCSACPDCGTPLPLTSRSRRSLRPLCGTVQFASPRLAHCRGKRRTTAAFRPLSALRTESVAPARLSMEATGSSLASYGMSLSARKDCLPRDRTLDVQTVRAEPLPVAKRLEAAWGADHRSFLDGAPSDGLLVPQPDGSCNVGIDGGYGRHGFAQPHNCEGMVGKRVRSVSAEAEAPSPSTKRLGFVQTLETQSTRRLYEVVHAQGLQMHQASPFRSDGDDTLRKLQWERSPQAPPILAWCPRTLQLTVLGQCGKGLVHCEAGLGEAIGNPIERLTWSRWHGQGDKALSKIDALETSLEPCSAT